MDVTHQSGFTLLELLIGLAVLAILLGIGVPELSETIRNSRIRALHNGVVGSVFLARSEAIKGASIVTLCARASDTSCGTSWENGWLVFVDGDTLGSVDVGDTVLRVTNPRTEGSTIQVIGSTDRSSASATARDHVRFEPRGNTHWKGGSFVICDERGAEHAQVVNLVLTGNARRGRRSVGSEIPTNVFGQPITCPAS